MHVQHNIDATTDPTSDDDSSAGYGERSIWMNQTDGKTWMCMDPKDGEAVWVLIGQTA